MLLCITHEINKVIFSPHLLFGWQKHERVNEHGWAIIGNFKTASLKTHLMPRLDAWLLQNFKVILCSWQTYLPTPFWRTLVRKALGVWWADMIFLRDLDPKVHNLRISARWQQDLHNKHGGFVSVKWICLNFRTADCFVTLPSSILSIANNHREPLQNEDRTQNPDGCFAHPEQGRMWLVSTKHHTPFLTAHRFRDSDWCGCQSLGGWVGGGHDMGPWLIYFQPGTHHMGIWPLVTRALVYPWCVTDISAVYLVPGSPRRVTGLKASQRSIIK